MTSLTVPLSIQSRVTRENNPCIISSLLYVNWSCWLAGYLAASLTLLVKRKWKKKKTHIFSDGCVKGAPTLLPCVCRAFTSWSAYALPLYVTVTIVSVFCHLEPNFSKSRGTSLYRPKPWSGVREDFDVHSCECRRYGELLPIECMVPRSLCMTGNNGKPFLWLDSVWVLMGGVSKNHRLLPIEWDSGWEC